MGTRSIRSSPQLHTRLRSLFRARRIVLVFYILKPQSSSPLHENSGSVESCSFEKVGHSSLCPFSRSLLIHSPNLPSLSGKSTFDTTSLSCHSLPSSNSNKSWFAQNHVIVGTFPWEYLDVLANAFPQKTGLMNIRSKSLSIPAELTIHLCHNNEGLSGLSSVSH